MHALESDSPLCAFFVLTKSACFDARHAVAYEAELIEFYRNALNVSVGFCAFS